MPPLNVAARILRETTERLASEVVSPSDTAPQWSELHWAIAPASAAIHGISALLHRRLKWTGPPRWQEFLEDQRRHSELRHRRISVLLGHIDAALRESGMSAVALKGAALRQLDLYADGERPMGDIDLLIRRSDLAGIEHTLGKLGYERIAVSRRHITFKPASHNHTHGLGEHEDNAVPIEVHTAVMEPLPLQQVDITDLLWPQQVSPGLNPYLDTSALMLHLLLHLAGNFRKHTARHIQLLDIALLAERLTANEWRNIVRSPDDSSVRWWLYAPLGITERYFGTRIPHDLRRLVHRSSPFTLRFKLRRPALTDVSFSNLRIPAFPGLTWSRTPLEAMHFMRSRIAPKRAQLNELREGVDANPHLKQLPWYDVPHVERIVRWLSGRAPRVQTVLSLRDAIDRFGVAPD